MSAQVRSEIISFLRRELIGPDPGYPAQQLDREEILRPQDPPRLRYSAGVLFPPKAAVALAENATEKETEAEASGVSEGNEIENEESGLGDKRADARGEGEVETEQEVNRANEYLPSALGISALVALPRCFASAFERRVTSGSQCRGWGGRTRMANGRNIGFAGQLK